MLKIRHLLLSIMLGLTLPAVAAPQVSDCAWLSGLYGSQDNGEKLEEQWFGAEANSLMGMCRIVAEGKTVHREFLLIEPDEKGLRLTLSIYNGPPKNLIFHCLRADPEGFLFQRDDLPETLAYTRLPGGGLDVRIHKQPEDIHFVLQRK